MSDKAKRAAGWPEDAPPGAVTATVIGGSTATATVIARATAIGSPVIGIPLRDAPWYFYDHPEDAGEDPVDPITHKRREYKEEAALGRLLLFLGNPCSGARATCRFSEDDATGSRRLMNYTLWPGLSPRYLDLENSSATDICGRRYTDIRVFGRRYPPPEANPVLLSDSEIAKRLETAAEGRVHTVDEYLIIAGRVGLPAEQTERIKAILQSLPESVRPRQGPRPRPRS
jgi:hypothetical protein